MQQEDLMYLDILPIELLHVTNTKDKNKYILFIDLWVKYLFTKVCILL